MTASPENQHLAHLIVSLEPWLDQVVMIGGWAHRVHRLDARALRLGYAPLMTLDTDIAENKTSILRIRSGDCGCLCGDYWV